MSEKCPTCGPMRLENAELNEEIGALMLLTRRQERALVKAYHDRDQALGDDPISDDVKLILELWRECCWSGRGRKPSIALNGGRAKIVRSALKYHTSGSRDERREILMDAVQGLGLRPYVVNAQRKAAGAPEQRYCDVEHAMGGEKGAPEKRIEEHAAYWQQVKGKDIAWLERAAGAACDVFMRWQGLLSAARYEERIQLAITRGVLPASQGRPQLELVVDNTDKEAA